MNRLGIIAGNGRFPFMVAQEARAQGYYIVAVALKEETDPALERCVDQIHWVSVGQVGKIISIFKKELITQALMAGQVKHNKLFSRIPLDLKALNILFKIKNKQTDSILSAVIKEFEKNGISFISSTSFLGRWMPGVGILSASHPTAHEWEDISFGFDIAKKISALDIGQTVVVKDKAVVAVEAMEGTDACIMRACDLFTAWGKRSDIVVVKVAKVHQDMRFDVPVLGLQTIEILKKAGARVLAFEASKTLLFDTDEFIRSADNHTISIVSYTGEKI